MNNKKKKPKKTMRLSKKEREFLLRHKILKEKKDKKTEEIVENKNIHLYDSEDISIKNTLDEVKNTEKLIDKTIEEFHLNIDASKEEELVEKDIEKVKEELENIEHELENFIPREKKKKKILKIIAVCLCLVFAVTVISFTQYNIAKSNALKRENEKAVNIASNAKEVNMGDVLRKQTVNKVKKEEKMESYSLDEIYNMDVSKPSGVTSDELKEITRQNLVGLEDAFVKAEKDYGVNCLFLVAIASMESANGTICFKPNNMFGYGSKGYDTKEDCIDDVANGLANNYLKEGASLYNGKKISDVNKRYASSSTWDDKVARNMYNYYQAISEKRNSALEDL